MRKVCEMFAEPSGKRLTESLRNTPPLPLPEPLWRVAAIVVSLQGMRHAADYDPAYGPTRTEAKTALFSSAFAIVNWERVRLSDPARLFLGMMLFPEGARR
jgi:hypothetical protein